MTQAFKKEIPKFKGKNPDEKCQLIFLKMCGHQQKQYGKDPLYIYWGCQTIFNFKVTISKRISK